MTELRQTPALHEAKQILRAILDHTTQPFFILDQNLSIRAMNQPARLIVEQLFGRPITEGESLVAPDDTPRAARFITILRQVLHGEPFTVREPLVSATGEIRWAQLTFKPIHDALGQRTGVCVETIMEHEESLAQDTARAAELDRFFSVSLDLLCILDGEGRLRRVNRQWSHVLDVPLTRLTGRSVLEFVHEEDQEKTRQWLASLQSADTEEYFVNRIRRHDGTLRWLEWRAATAGSAIYAAARDISERKQAEETLRQSRDQLHTANAALEQAARLKDEFLANMSHELRTPLTGVLGLAEALHKGLYGPLTERQIRTLQLIEESGRHVLELINDLLDMAKIDAGRLTLLKQLVVIDDVCQASLRMVHQMAKAKRHTVRYWLEPADAIMQADGRRLTQILVNLLSNAVKFTPEEGELGLTVELVESEGVARFTVWDKGIGISSDDLNRLFRPFVQIDSAQTSEQMGTGLGLSMALRLTELHGGSLTVESIPGAGSRFRVTLPLGERDLGRAARVMEEGPGNYSTSPDVPPSADGPLILVADDNLVNVDLLRGRLMGAGYRVATALNGAEALHHAHTLAPAVILMDIQMPDIDGLEATRRIRADGDRKVAQTPILALSALTMPGDRERCLAAGANDYLSKPIDFDKLFSIIDRFIDQAVQEIAER